MTIINDLHQPNSEKKAGAPQQVPHGRLSEDENVGDVQDRVASLQLHCVTDWL